MSTPMLSFHCIELHQPIGTFYVGAISSDDLIRIAFADVRKIKEGKPRDIEEFSGIQRPLSYQRVEKIAQYVNTVDASFPTSIILHVDEKDAEFSSKGVMLIRKEEDVARIIDGQHRIAGLEKYAGPPFQLNVAILVGMDMEEQALLFATINLEQTKVNRSLAYDLFSFAKTRSPQKTAHGIARLLNEREESPFYHRIKILGTATGGRKETITQALVVDQLMPLLTDNKVRDRNALKQGLPLPAATVSRSAPCTFRSLFAEDRDGEIARILWNFFSAVALRWPNAWTDVTPGLVLNRTTGFVALMKALPKLYHRLHNDGPIVPIDRFLEELKKVRLEDHEFTKERFVPGTSGQSALTRVLLHELGFLEESAG